MLGAALADSADEFAYFDMRKIAGWAGPDHWKFRPPSSKTGAHLHHPHTWLPLSL
jgi:hypothetical protein